MFLAGKVRPLFINRGRNLPLAKRDVLIFPRDRNAGDTR